MRADIRASEADMTASPWADIRASRADTAASIGDNRPRVTGTVLVDVSAYVDDWGRLTPDGQRELWGGLVTAAGLSVRLSVGNLLSAESATSASEALTAAYLCTSVEVCGTDPATVADIVTWLRTHHLTAEEADNLTYFMPDTEGDA